MVTEAISRIHPRNLKHLAGHLQGLLRTRLWAQILVALVLGVGVGLLFSPGTDWLERETAVVLGEWLALPGMLFLTLIQMIVIPLIVSAIIRGLASATSMEQLRRGGIWLLLYFVVTSIAASALGISLGLVLQPGGYIESEALQAAEPVPEEVQSVELDRQVDLEALPREIVSVLPTNPLGAMVSGQMLQVVVFSILLGVALLSLNPVSSKPILDLLGSVQDLCMKIVAWAMYIAPLAVFGLMARQMIQTGPESIIGLGAYAGSVILGMALLLVLYLLIVRLLGGYGMGSFMSGARDAQLLAFATDSSAATMPVTIRVAEEKLDIRPSISQFVIPIGATVNMGGTALYQGLATVFMAQVFGIDLPMGALIALVITALGASVGTPATPGVGIIVLATVLTSAGVPLSGLGLILGMDQILERFRTVLNVTGDLTAARVMEHLMGTDHERAAEVRDQATVESIQERSHEDVVITRT